MTRQPYTIGLMMLILASLARADIYASAALVSNFSGKICATCRKPDNDVTYQIFGDQTGWQRFDLSTNNPIPAFLLTIDPNFNTKYMVDSLVISIKEFGGNSGSANWRLDVGDGTHAGGSYQQIPITRTGSLLGVDTFALTPADAAFQSAVAGTAGSFMFRFTDTTSAQDDLWVFNTSTVVRYSDRPMSSTPEPSSAQLAGLVLVAVGAVRKFRSKSVRP